jgi:hypothetical protein
MSGLTIVSFNYEHFPIFEVTCPETYVYVNWFCFNSLVSIDHNLLLHLFRPPEISSSVWFMDKIVIFLANRR